MVKILLLEDNQFDADLTTRELTKSLPGCSLDKAPTLEAARSLLASGTIYDIGLFDMQLPDGNGMDLLLEVRETHPDLAVVILTGTGDEEVAVTALRSGADDYVAKKQDYASGLPEVVRYALENRKKIRLETSEIIQILYIEHNHIDTDLTLRHLKQYAPFIRVDSVATAEEALELLPALKNGEFPYKVILMDYRLPGISAMELIKILRMERKLTLPIILVTGQGSEETAVQALKLGANEYLTKNSGYLHRLPSLIVNAYQYHELKRRQEALKESESKYRLLAENSGDVIFVLDTNFNFTYVSPAIRTLRGYEPEEALHQNIADVLTPDSARLADRLIKEYLTLALDPDKASQTQIDVELEMVRKDRSTVWTEIKATFIHDQEKKLVGIQGVARDISARKFAMEELRKLSRAIEQSPASVIITDTMGRIEYVNPKFEEMSGYALSEVMGKTPRILKSGYTKNSEYENLWKTITSGNEWRGEFRNKRKDGTLYWEQGSISPIKDRHGNITHYLAVKEDITEKKRMIDELIRAKNKAEESNQLKSAFLANISHEIRTPLNGILGFADLLQNQELSEDEQGLYLKMLKESSDRMLATITDIIEISKIEAGDITATFSQMHINELVNSLSTQYKAEAEKKGLTFILTNRLEGKAIFIETDKAKLESVLRNLLRNAIKFTPAGFVEWELSTFNNQLLFRIKDSGMGIPAEKLETIFHHFVQANDTYARPYEGVGLGLTIARSFAAKLGGTISVESSEGKGSTFTFSLPMNQDNGHHFTGEVHHSAESLSSLGDPVLIVEDDEFNYLYLDETLRKMNLRLLRASNGEEAVNICRENPDIALVLMDIKLPLLNGYDATRKIREFRPALPIIAQTAYSQDIDKDKMWECGCSDYLIKPFKREVLLTKIKEHISGL